jgi:hypothetical protein
MSASSDPLILPRAMLIRGSMRMVGNVATEASLHILAYNIKRTIALLGVPGLIAALQG